MRPERGRLARLRAGRGGRRRLPPRNIRESRYCSRQSPPSPSFSHVQRDLRKPVLHKTRPAGRDPFPLPDEPGCGDVGPAAATKRLVGRDRRRPRQRQVGSVGYADSGNQTRRSTRHARRIARRPTAASVESRRRQPASTADGFDRRRLRAVEPLAPIRIEASLPPPRLGPSGDRPRYRRASRTLSNRADVRSGREDRQASDGRTIAAMDRDEARRVFRSPSRRRARDVVRLVRRLRTKPFVFAVVARDRAAP